MRILLLFVTLSFLLLASSCKKYVPAEEASFLQPGTISVSTTTAQGTGNHKITDLWVYVNGQFQGAYPVENTIPIVTKGEPVSLDIKPGIKNNGITSTRMPWLLYDWTHIDTTLPSGVSFVRPFTFKYNSACTFTWVENFEGAGFSVINSAKSDTAFSIKSQDGIEGRYLNFQGPYSSSVNIIQIESTGDGFKIPLNTANVYLELNYKCNADVLVGVYASSGEEKEALHLNPQSNWNKIYIQLGGTLNMAPATSTHKVFFRMYKTSDQPRPELSLDNIKLVYIP